MEVIRVENLSKLYRLGEVGTGTVSHDLNRWWAKMRGKEDPFAKVGKVNNRASKSEGSEYVWALQDINFNVNQGDVLGIIGRNGAGKSTLLKIISRITGPTKGNIKIKGRVAALLEVGTGFHLEMTGRENIFMNGTLMGMSRKEIQSKLDEIVDFAGVAMYLDTPVKRYSSGMMVRLGFAVAAFLEPEILIVDEVLAVGDAEFQKKALGRMQDVSKNDGRTVLFVSHNMAALKTLCSRAVLLENGFVSAEGKTDQLINLYLVNSLNPTETKTDGEILWEGLNRPGKDELRLDWIKLFGADRVVKSLFMSDQPIFCSIKYTLLDNLRNFRLNMQIRANDDTILFTKTTHSIEPVNKINGSYVVTFEIPPFLFNQGTFKVYLQADIPGVKVFGLGSSYITFYVQLNHEHGTLANEVLRGYLSPIIDISYE